jgi:cyclomaltodextrinase
LNESHAHGIRVLLDFVPNHWSSLHPTFQAAIADPESPYVDWYNFERWPDRYESFFGVADLPQVNLHHPAARQYMLDAAAYWLEFGVDGYRLDYAIGPVQEFWADFRKTTRTMRPECWTFGEVVEPSDSQLNFQGLLDGCLDFILLEALRQTFAYGNWDAARLASFLDRHEAYFPADFSRPSFLDNHDMNRFLWAAGNDPRRLRLAALCQFTLAGPPVIYYGTEVGLSQVRDVRQDGRGLPEESRLPMLWGKDQDQDLLAFYRKLIGLRRDMPALRRGNRRTLVADGQLLAYQIALDPEDPKDVSGLIATFNLGADSLTFSLEGRQFQLALATGEDCRLLASPSNRTEIVLPGLSAVLLRSTR